MAHCLIAHCPTFGCKEPNQPIAKIDLDSRPEFDPSVYVVVACSSCGKEFRELASALDWSPTTS